LVGGDESIDDFVNVAVEVVVQMVKRQTDTVVGETTLRIVVGTNALGTVTGTDLGTAFRSNGLGLSFAVPLS